MKKDYTPFKWVDESGITRITMMDKNKFEYYPEDMDKDMIPLCNAINKLKGARTFYCCSGHGRKRNEFYLMIGVKTLKTLKHIVHSFDLYGIRSLPPGYSFYLIETDSSFWALKKKEIGLRISNRWVSGLNAAGRKKEFSRLVRRLKSK